MINTTLCYIRRGEDGPLPKVTGAVSNLYTSLPGAFGGMCFLAMEAAPELPRQMRDALRGLKQEGKLHHGAGTFQYDGWAIWL